MKRLFAVILLAASSSGYAMTVTTNVPSFSGEIISDGPELVIQSIKLAIDNHFCSIGTCAGGPDYYKYLKVEVSTAPEGQSTRFYSPDAGSYKTTKLFGNFGFCSVHMFITAKNPDGLLVSGDQDLISISDPIECSDSSEVGLALSRRLAEPLRIKSATDSLIIEYP